MRYLLLFLWLASANTGASVKSVFVGYDIGEMAFNKFRHFSGEAGIRFENGWNLTVAHMNVLASETHLSSEFATSVDGDGIEGEIRGVELFLTNRFYGGWYFGGSVGHYANEFRNLHDNQSLKNVSPTVGFKFGYRQDAAFGFPNLYWDFGIPVRHTLEHYNDTALGSAIVRSNAFENNLWFNIGFNFSI